MLPNSFPSIMFFRLVLLSTLAFAQYPPPVKDTLEIRTSYNPNIFVRYKNPSSAICATTNPDQKQFSGYIHLPPMTLAPVQQDYPINTFFWFVEARENPESAPLTIWLNGGPGSSSMIGMFTEMGPCTVVEAGRESITTIPREYGWDRGSNMLFLDQPNQVGFSYDTPTNGTLPLLDPNGTYLPNTVASSQNQTYQDLGISDDEFLNSFIDIYYSIALLNGTFPSGNSKNTANTTEIATRSAWHFLQAWLRNFPQYNPNNTGINLFAESYGGKYGPSFFAFFEEQNRLRDEGKLSKEDTVELHLESLGIVNGCIDAKLQTPSYPIYANSNPYGIKVINDTMRDQMLELYYMVGGCRDLIDSCRESVNKSDPESFGDDEHTNSICRQANSFCGDIMGYSWENSNRSYYDIASNSRDPFPESFFLEYLNNVTVQEAIGTPVNYTESNTYVWDAFNATGDFVRGGQLEDIAYLLEHGVRVALLYGDRDFICNYIGGESVSLAIEYPQSSGFRAAGYEDVRVNSSYIGGQVRQYGNFSFTRVYQAGHLIPSYQPETAFVLFDRGIRGVSLATGEDIETSGGNIYSTSGPANTTVRLVAPGPHKAKCFVRSIRTCNPNEVQMIAGGKGVIINGVLYNSTDEYVDPAPLDSPGTRTTNMGPSASSRNSNVEYSSNAALAIGARGSTYLLVAGFMGMVLCGL